MPNSMKFLFCRISAKLQTIKLGVNMDMKFFKSQMSLRSTFFLLPMLLLFTLAVHAEEKENTEFSSVEERRIFALLDEERKQLQKDRNDLEMRENELKTLEASVDKKITEIDNKLKELKSLQGKIETLLAEKDDREKKRIKELSTIYNKMAPGRAALAIGKMDPTLATDLLANMKPKAAARILDALDKQKTSNLSTTFTKIQIE